MLAIVGMRDHAYPRNAEYVVVAILAKPSTAVDYTKYSAVPPLYLV